MEEKVPLYSVILAALGAVLISNTSPAVKSPNPSLSPARNSNPAASQVIAPTEAARVRNAHCVTAPDPLQPLCFLVYDPAGEPPSRDRDWKELAWLEKAKAAVKRTLIVMVADPEETGDTLRFDRSVDSIQNAAESLGYVLSDYWIPWQAMGSTAGDPSGDRDSENRSSAAGQQKNRSQPGLLLFREIEAPESESPPGLLLAFLVGESPISGPQSLQFLNAAHYIEALSTTETLDEVLVAGPLYSGSFQPLKGLIDESGLGRAHGACTTFRVDSPSATVLKAGTEFARHNVPGKSDIDFHFLVQNDRDANSYFYAYALDRWGIRGAGQAVVAEAGTVFGRSESSGGVPPLSSGLTEPRLYVQFPRGIARLRNASRDADGTTLTIPGGGTIEEDRLQVRLSGPRPGRDSVPGMAREHMPVAQDAVLIGIASTLRQERIEMARIAATDVFDTIFLASFLRKAYPEVRIYVSDADLLMVRAAERLPIDGSLVVTTFPLLSRSQVWSQQDNGRLVLRPMSSRLEVGLYNAIRALLLEGGDTAPVERSFPAPGFRNEPHVWLTVVGTNGYWPIALLENPDSAPADDLLLRKTATSPAGDRWPSTGRPAWLWPLVFMLLLLGALALAMTVILGHCGRLTGLLKWLRVRAPAEWAADPDEHGVSVRAFFSGAACLVAGFMLFAIASPVWVLSWHSSGDFRMRLWTWASVAVFLLVAIAAAVPYRKVTRRKKSDLYLLFSVLAGLGFLFCVGAWWWAIEGGHRFEGFFFGYRSLDLLNGVCPTMPFLLLGGGYLVLISLHDRRFARFLDMPSTLPPVGEGYPELIDNVRDPLEHPLVSHRPLVWILVACGWATMVFLPLLGQQSLESKSYDFLYKLALVVFYALVVLTWARAVLLGTDLRNLLDGLACHRLRAAFAALSPDFTVPPLLHIWGRRDTLLQLSASVKLLRELSQNVSDRCLRTGLERKLQKLDAESPVCRHSGHRRSPRFVSRQELLREAGNEIAAYWEQHWKSAIPAPPSEIVAKSAGEKFIALEYAGWIANALFQFRDLVLFTTTGFFLCLVSTLVYPFRSQDQFVWVGTLNFILLGAPVVLAVIRVASHPLLHTLTGGQSRRPIPSSLARLSVFGALPIVGLVCAHFPEVGRYLVSLLQPAMQAVR